MVWEDRTTLLIQYLWYASPPEPEAVQSILELTSHAIKICHIDEYGANALKYAVTNKQTPLAVFKIIVEAGADIHQQTCENKSVLTKLSLENPDY